MNEALSHCMHSFMFLRSPPCADVCALFRKLGYRPDSARVASLFADLNRRIAAGEAAGDSGAAATDGRRQSGPQSATRQQRHVADDSEMHLHAFIDLMRQADVAASSAAFTNLGSSSDEPEAVALDQDLSDLLRSFELMASSGESAAPGLLDVRALRHRMGLARGSKLSDAELAALIDCAGVLDASGAPAPHMHVHHTSATGAAMPMGFIDYRGLVRKMAANKLAEGI